MWNFFFGRTVGLTGGLASGKSTVVNLFRAHGIRVVDADLIARAQLNWGTPGYTAVVAAFGPGIVREDGEIDRPILSNIVSYDPAMRLLLYGLLSPYIKADVLWEIMKLRVWGHQLIVVDAPMLFEARMELTADINIVVWVDPETQVQRLMARDEISEEDAMNRIDAEMPLHAKWNLAHTIIDNTGSLDALNEQFHGILLEVSTPSTLTEFIRALRKAPIFTALATVVVLWRALFFITLAVVVVLRRVTGP